VLSENLNNGKKLMYCLNDPINETFAKLRKAVIPANTLKGTGTGIQKYLNSLDVACASEDNGFRRNDRKWLSKLFCKGL
jgi:hypothetical protein